MPGRPTILISDPTGVAGYLAQRFMGIPKVHAAQAAGFHQRTVHGLLVEGEAVASQWAEKDPIGLTWYLNQIEKRIQTHRKTWPDKASAADTLQLLADPEAHGLGRQLPVAPPATCPEAIRPRLHYLIFFLAEGRVNRERISRRLSEVEAAAPADWRAAAWLLERDDPESFGKQVLEIHHENQPKVPDEPAQSATELAERLEQLENRLGALRRNGRAKAGD